jgi:hypothetical protein
MAILLFAEQFLQLLHILRGDVDHSIVHEIFSLIFIRRRRRALGVPPSGDLDVFRSLGY